MTTTAVLRSGLTLASVLLATTALLAAPLHPQAAQAAPTSTVAAAQDTTAAASSAATGTTAAAQSTKAAKSTKTPKSAKAKRAHKAKAHKSKIHKGHKTHKGHKSQKSGKAHTSHEARQTPKVAQTPQAPKIGTQRTIVDATFDDTRPGQVDPSSFRREVGPTINAGGAYFGMTYRKDYRGKGNVVRTELAANKFVQSSGPGRGNILPFKLPGSYDSACMSYDIRFAAPFDFSAGGKLPGFVGVAPGTKPSVPEGGGSTAHGWSGRMMWLGSKMWKFVRDADRSNMAVTYLYHPGQYREYGDNVSWGASFTPGLWHNVKQCHAMNTIGKADGVLQTWFDGKLVMSSSDVVYRTDPNVHITHFDWSIFRGGNSAVWASAQTAFVDLDNLKITAG